MKRSECLRNFQKNFVVLITAFFLLRRLHRIDIIVKVLITLCFLYCLNVCFCGWCDDAESKFWKINHNPKVQTAIKNVILLTDRLRITNFSPRNIRNWIFNSTSHFVTNFSSFMKKIKFPQISFVVPTKTWFWKGFFFLYSYLFWCMIVKRQICC